MTNSLATRALGAGFAAALVLGAAACGDDDEVDTDGIEQDVGEVGEGLEQEGEELED